MRKNVPPLPHVVQLHPQLQEELGGGYYCRQPTVTVTVSSAVFMYVYYIIFKRPIMQNQEYSTSPNLAQPRTDKMLNKQQQLVPASLVSSVLQVRWQLLIRGKHTGCHMIHYTVHFDTSAQNSFFFRFWFHS